MLDYHPTEYALQGNSCWLVFLLHKVIVLISNFRKHVKQGYCQEKTSTEGISKAHESLILPTSLDLRWQHSSYQCNSEDYKDEYDLNDHGSLLL